MTVHYKIHVAQLDEFDRGQAHTAQKCGGHPQPVVFSAFLRRVKVDVEVASFVHTTANLIQGDGLRAG